MKRKTETEHFQKILEHPSFKANPLQAITEHINNRSIFDKVSALNFTQVFFRILFFFFCISVTIEQQARKEQLDQQRLKEKLKLKKQKRKQQKEQQKN